MTPPIQGILLPEKSQQTYRKHYEICMELCKSHNIKYLREEVFLVTSCTIINVMVYILDVKIYNYDKKEH